MVTQYAIDRSGMPGSPSPLVVAATPLTSTYLLLVEGLARPDITWRRTYAGDSPFTHGSEPVSAVREQSSIPMRVMVQAASAAALDAAAAEWEDALSQWAYDLTQTVEGVAKVWSAEPADWSTGTWDYQSASEFWLVYALTIPVYPIPGA